MGLLNASYGAESDDDFEAAVVLEKQKFAKDQPKLGITYWILSGVAFTVT